MLDVHSYTSRSLREAIKFSSAVAALFLIAALFCLYWLYNNGAFGSAPVEHPVDLKAGPSINVHFSVPYRGGRDIEIWYPRHASDDVNEEVRQIFGEMTLRTDGSLIEQKVLPVDHFRSDRDGFAMVIFTGPMEPRNDYSLLLQVDRIPQSLANSQARVKVEITFDYYSIFLQLELVVTLLLLATASCAFLSVRWWRASVPSDYREQARSRPEGL